MIEYKSSSENEAVAESSASHDLLPLLGTWHNTKAATKHVKTAKFSLENGVLKLQAFGACEPELCDWGQTDCRVFSDTITSSVVTGIAADYDFGFKKTQIAGNIKQGILVLQVYNTFQDNSNRINYFSREFYYREGGN